MNLKAAAVIAGLRGTEIARRFGVSNGQVSKWLNRLAQVPDKNKAEFAAMLGIKVEDLLPPADNRARSDETESVSGD